MATQNKYFHMGMVAHTCNPSTQKAKENQEFEAILDNLAMVANL